MKKYITLTFLLLFIGAFGVSAQQLGSDKYLQETFAAYNKELKLTPEKAQNFKNILKKYNGIISDLTTQKKDDNLTFNKTVKLQDLEIFKILNSEQFEIYKKAKALIEPTKKYRS